MKRSVKILSLLVALLGVAFSSMADRGIGRKNKSKISLNIATPSNFIKSDISFNLKLGLKYTGSLLTKDESKGKCMTSKNMLVTYQKGNTIYIIPYKEKITVPEIKQGYTGVKLILRAK